MKSRGLFILVVLTVAAVLLTGCTAAKPQLSIEGAYGQPSMSMPTAGAMFMMIKNSGSADKLLSGSSEACGSVEVHETVMKSDGTMGMNLLDKPLDIPANGQVELKPGGIHIMCIMKKDDVFKPGAKVDLDLVFEKSGEQHVTVEIKME